MGVPFPKNCPSHWGFGPPYNSRFHGPAQARNPNGISIGSAAFAQMTVECPYTLQWNTPFSPQNCPFAGGSGPPSSTWFSGPTGVFGAAVFAGLISVTDQQTTLLCR